MYTSGINAQGWGHCSLQERGVSERKHKAAAAQLQAELDAATAAAQEAERKAEVAACSAAQLQAELKAELARLSGAKHNGSSIFLFTCNNE